MRPPCILRLPVCVEKGADPRTAVNFVQSPIRSLVHSRLLLCSRFPVSLRGPFWLKANRSPTYEASAVTGAKTASHGSGAVEGRNSLHGSR